jgi:hypothetical protein
MVSTSACNNRKYRNTFFLVTTVMCIKHLSCKRRFVGLARTVYIHRIYTVYLMISLPKIPYKHRICMVLANPTDLHVVKDDALRPTASLCPKEIVDRQIMQTRVLLFEHKVLLVHAFVFLPLTRQSQCVLLTPCICQQHLADCIYRLCTSLCFSPLLVSLNACF